MPDTPPSRPVEPVATQTWTAQQDARLLDLKNKKGLFWVRIAEELGDGLTGAEVKARYTLVMQHSLTGRKVRSGDRLCLSCQKVFRSPDLTRFKCCETCRANNATLPEQYVCVTGSSSHSPGLAPGCRNTPARRDGQDHRMGSSK